MQLASTNLNRPRISTIAILNKKHIINSYHPIYIYKIERKNLKNPKKKIHV